MRRVAFRYVPVVDLRLEAGERDDRGCDFQLPQADAAPPRLGVVGDVEAGTAERAVLALASPPTWSLELVPVSVLRRTARLRRGQEGDCAILGVCS